MKIGELFVQLGVKTDSKPLQNFKRSIVGLRQNLILVQAAAAAAVFGLSKFAGGTIDATAAIVNISKQTGLAVDKLQRLQQAGQLADITLTADQLANSIANVQKNIAAIKLGQGDVSGFGFLNISPENKDAFEVLEDVRESIKGLDNATAVNLISKIGLSPQFINVLRLSKKEFKSLGDNKFLSKQQRKDILDLGTAFKALQLRLGALKDQAVAKIAPKLQGLVDGFFNWMKLNGAAVINAISGIASVFGTFLSVVGNAVAIVGTLVSSIFGAAGGLKALAGIIAIITVSFSPLVAAAVGLLLVLDDIATFLSGGESITGDVFNAVSDSVDFLVGKLSALEQMLININQFFANLFAGSFNVNISSAVDDAIKSVSDAISGNSIFSDISSLFNGNEPQLETSFAGTPQAAEATRNISQNKSTVNNNSVNIDVHTTADARETAGLTADAVVNAYTSLNNVGR
tara:strand:- start:9927 stop:11306 length:1380 start_codon:yes stop_codon:yes gene_type:complete